MAEIKQFKTFRDLGKVSNPSTDTSTTSTPSSASVLKSTSLTSRPSTSSTASRTSTSRPTRIPRPDESEVSPQKDFQKVPNSITRDAVPAGIFRGKSKLVYDYLWSQSRGGINPTRFVKVSRRQIKEKTAIGSMVTIDAALGHLQSVGLIRKASAIGSASGNNYEILAPDELPSTASTTSTTSLTQKMDELDVLKTGTSRETEVIDNKDGYSRPKTIFKDIEQFDDDSPLYEAIKEMNEAAKKTTGRELNKNDMKALADVLRLFVNETNLAASRTHSISSYVALGAENLRRRLYAQKLKETPKKPLKDWKNVGTSEPKIESIESVEPVEPLDEEVRGTVLNSLRQMVKQNGRESIEFFKSNYTLEDWNWLVSALKTDEKIK